MGNTALYFVFLSSFVVSKTSSLLQKNSYILTSSLVVRRNFHNSVIMSAAIKRERDDENVGDGADTIKTEIPSKKISKVSQTPSLASNTTVIIPRQLHVPGIDSVRGRLLTPKNNDLPTTGKCVVLWMFRDQRMHDNHALLYAQAIAKRHNVPIKVVFNLVPSYLDATIRQFGFMIKGLAEVEQQLREKNIPMYLTMGDPTINIPQFVKDHESYMLVSDFSPLRVTLSWILNIAENLDNSTSVPVVQIDAHNIVPCWEASNKLEYGARTIRPKINDKLPQFLKEFPLLENNPAGSLDGCQLIDWDNALKSLKVNREVAEVTWIKPGYTGAWDNLNSFVSTRLKDYKEKRNDPNNHVSSDISPYIHFGQISIQRIILHVKSLKKSPDSTASFIEESVVRRELADNFCFYNTRYDSLDSCYDWAKQTLAVHAKDARPYVYTQEQLENAQSHEDLWNAAQLQLNTTGKMHGFLRMYWAKKILEWTVSPAEALRITIYLNDKYSIDGRDPNGYVGIMWSIGGIHDQGWGERPVFGKIRYMNYDGCKRKFDVKAFVSKFPQAAINASKASKSSK